MAVMASHGDEGLAQAAQQAMARGKAVVGPGGVRFDLGEGKIGCKLSAISGPLNG